MRSAMRRILKATLRQPGYVMAAWATGTPHGRDGYAYDFELAPRAGHALYRQLGTRRLAPVVIRAPRRRASLDPYTADDLEQRPRLPFHQPQYRNLLLTAGVQISMDGRGRALDNIFVERLWRSVKYEEV